MNYAYIRVSTELQNYSSQEFEIKKWCASREISIDKWVSESVSGTVNYKKRALGHIIRRMGREDCIICTEISRLGRNMLMIMSILNDCAAKGIRIYTIKDHFELSDNINSKIIAFAFALAAEIERNLISQRTREALAAKRQEGVKLGRPAGPTEKFNKVRNDIEQIRAALENNVPVTRIAKKYGIHRNTLTRYLRIIID
ncbi:MAG: recombinase family protein [Candidatus Cryptobacteroides sp.]